MPESAPAVGDDGPATPATPHGRRRPSLLARAGHLEYDRILFFSDAVFAIAITLLIVDLPIQVERGSGAHETVNAARALRDSVPGIIGFGISFAVIALFWAGHHGLFRYIRAFDRPLMLLNLLFIGTIAFLPFPTELLSATSTDQRAAVVFYAVCAGSAGLAETVIWIYATHARADLVADIGPAVRRVVLLRAARLPTVFAVSVVIALADPKLAVYSWALIWVSGVVINRRFGDQPALEDLATAGDPGQAAGEDADDPDDPDDPAVPLPEPGDQESSPPAQ